MKIWNIFKKPEMPEGLSLFKVTYESNMTFGVTAASATEAEELVCEQIFHNQTIPGTPPEVEELKLSQVKKLFSKVSLQKVLLKGVWFFSN